jgi:hypothetical protein
MKNKKQWLIVALISPFSITAVILAVTYTYQILLILIVLFIVYNFLKVIGLFK